MDIVEGKLLPVRRDGQKAENSLNTYVTEDTSSIKLLQVLPQRRDEQLYNEKNTIYNITTSDGELSISEQKLYGKRRDGQIGTDTSITALEFYIAPAPTPSITPSISVTPTITPSISITPTITPSISITPTPVLSPSITPSITASVTPSITPSLTPSISITPTITPSISISRTPSITPSITPSTSRIPYYDYDIVTTSYSTYILACGTMEIPDDRIYFDTTIPTIGHYGYQDTSLSTIFIGDGNWYYITDGVVNYTIQLESNGMVMDFVDCDNMPTPTPTSTPSRTPSISITPSITPSRTPSVSPSRTPSQSTIAAFQYDIVSTTTYGTSTAACETLEIPDDIVYLTTSTPVTGNYVYTNSSLTTYFTGDERWYYLYNGTKFAVQIMSDGYINDVFSCNAISPSVTPSRTPSITPSISLSRTPSITPSISLSRTPSITPSISLSSTPSITPSITPTRLLGSPSVTPSITPSTSLSRTPSITPSISLSRTPSVTPSVSFSRTPSATPSVSFSRTPSVTPSMSFSRTPSVTPTRPAASPSRTPSVTPSMSISRTPSVTPSRTPSTSPPQTAWIYYVDMYTCVYPFCEGYIGSGYISNTNSLSVGDFYCAGDIVYEIKNYTSGTPDYYTNIPSYAGYGTCNEACQDCSS